MWERIRTAIFLLIVVGVAMFATHTALLMLPLLLVGVTVGSFEWSKLMPDWASNAQTLRHYTQPSTQIPTKPARSLDYFFSLLVLALTAMVFVLGLFFHLTAVWVVTWGLAAIIWLVAIGWIVQYPQGTGVWYGKQLYALGVIILVAAITAMYYLWSLSPWWLLYVFVLVWCADSGAYFVGRKLGKRKMSPHVSPNKSIEGLIGGLLTGVLVVIGVTLGLLSNWSALAIGVFLLLSLVTILMSVFGDLFESMLKRHAGVKDAGTLLPGHGGILDRIDSQLSAMPIFAFGFWAMQYAGLI
ncbi:MAG: phosphatidate cytidylyltransferase [Moraxella sp.]|jgi:phosphatidate cytidylyltransferase